MRSKVFVTVVMATSDAWFVIVFQAARLEHAHTFTDVECYVPLNSRNMPETEAALKPAILHDAKVKTEPGKQ